MTSAGSDGETVDVQDLHRISDDDDDDDPHPNSALVLFHLSETLSAHSVLLLLLLEQ